MHDPLAALGINPATLQPAPSARPRSSVWRARLTPPDPAPCSVCGAPAAATRIITLDDQPLYLDLCRDDMLHAAGWRVAS